jgi:hypothetical protein
MKNRLPRLRTVRFDHGAPLLVDSPGLTVRELLEKLGEPGLAVAVLIFALPFILPVTLPGLSLPIGVLLVLLGAGIAAGRSPWLPERTLARHLSGRRWGNILLSASRLTKRLERPGLSPPPPRRSLFTGAAIALAGVTLAAGTPLPFSNFLPGVACFCFAAALLRRSKSWLVAGYFVLAFAVAYPVSALILGRAGLHALWARLAGR